MASTTPAPSFMTKLAANDKSVRDGAVDQLRTYLRSRASFSEIELLKLWKGLFYCMWMSDKPRNQQQLARDLAGLIDVVRKDTVIPFLDAFWKTMAREWTGIPQLRMDKYLYLVRQYLHGSFRYFAKTKWTDLKMVDEFMVVLKETPLSAGNMRIPNGMRYHMLDIYVDEIEKVKDEYEGEMPAETLLSPILLLQKDSPTKVVRERAKETLDDERVREWLGLEPLDKVMNDVEDDEETSSGTSGKKDVVDDAWGGFDD